MGLTMDHIGILTGDLDKAVKVYGGLGLTLEETESFGESKIGFMHVGESMIELLAPVRPGIGRVAEWLSTKGEGIHHIAIKVDDIDQVLAKLKKAGIRMVDERPRNGTRGTRIAFIDASAMGNVSIELVEHPK